MEFIPETLQALGELDPLVDDDLVDQLSTMAARAQAIVPELVGLSLAVLADDVTFTLVASDEEIAALDAVQYVTSGPCVDAMEAGRGVATSEGGLLSEQRWHELAVAAAAKGVRSTLTFPIVSDERVVGTVNIYGRDEDSFVGKHEELAQALHAWAPGAVSNADLSFSTRDAARNAPSRLRDDALVDTATGILAAEQYVSVDDARQRLHDASWRADVPVAELARLIVEIHRSGY